MNKKFLSIACLVLILFITSKASASEVTILGIPADQIISTGVGKTTITCNPGEIIMLNISNMGIDGHTGRFSSKHDARDRVITHFNDNPPNVIAGSFTTTASAAVNLGGSIVGKRLITISANSFSLQPLTVFGTNGPLTLNLTNPLSLIKSLTMNPSDITATHCGENFHIGSVWGEFTGAPSSEEQIIHLCGYPSIAVEFNPAAIVELLSKK